MLVATILPCKSEYLFDRGNDITLLTPYHSIPHVINAHTSYLVLENASVADKSRAVQGMT